MVSRVGVNPVAVNTSGVGVGSMVCVGATGRCVGIEPPCEQPLIASAPEMSENENEDD